MRTCSQAVTLIRYAWCPLERTDVFRQRPLSVDMESARPSQSTISAVHSRAGKVEGLILHLFTCVHGSMCTFNKGSDALEARLET